MSTNVFEQWKTEATRDKQTARVCFDRALLSELEKAEAALADVSPDGMLDGEQSKAAKKAEAEVERIRGVVEEKTREFVFESIGGRAWRDLLSQYPPTPEQKKAYPGLDHNPETFPAVALSKTCVEPGMDEEQAKWFLDNFPIGVIDRVWAACLTANVVGSRDPFATGSPRVGKRK